MLLLPLCFCARALREGIPVIRTVLNSTPRSTSTARPFRCIARPRMRCGEEPLDSLEMSELEEGGEVAAGTRTPVGVRDEGFWLNWAFTSPRPTSTDSRFRRGTDDGSGSSMVRYTPPARQRTLADLDSTVGTAMVAMGTHLGAEDVSFMESYMDPSESDWSQRVDARTKEENFAALRSGRMGAPRTSTAKAILSETDFSFSFTECPSIREIEVDESEAMSLDPCRHGSLDTTVDSCRHGGGRAQKGDVLALVGHHAPSPLATTVAADFE